MDRSLIPALILTLFLGCSDGEPPVEQLTPKPGIAKLDMGEGYEYEQDTLRRIRILLGTEDWSLTDPPRNPQGFLEAIHAKTALTFLLLPAGEFQMGSEASEPRQEDEGPVRRVTVPAFLLSRTECTQSSWERIGAISKGLWRRPELPIETVDWHDVREWCGKTGLRLPSEAEWEYACRAGTTTRFSWGDDDDLMKCRAAYARTRQEPATIDHTPRKGLPFAGPTVVATYPPNPWGLYDMHGNVWEWCEDVYASYSEAPVDGSPHLPGGDVHQVVLRGGGWVYAVLNCRSANRQPVDPAHFSYRIGFRPARSLPNSDACTLD